MNYHFGLQEGTKSQTKLAQKCTRYPGARPKNKITKMINATICDSLRYASFKQRQRC